MVEKCPKGRLKPSAVQVPRPVVPKQPKGCLKGHLWNQEKSNQETIRSNMVFQKFGFGKTHVGGVGWVGKCCSALGIRQRGWEQPLLWHPWTGPCTRQKLQNKTETLRTDAWMSTAPVGQAEMKLPFLLLYLYAVGPLGLLRFVFFPWSYFLFLNPLVWKPTVALCAQYFSVTPSTFCVYVYFQVHSGVLKLGGITAPAFLPYLFQSKHNQKP